MKQRMIWRSVLVSLAAAILAVVPASGTEALEGSYLGQVNGDRFEFYEDGTVIHDGVEGTYLISEDQLTILSEGYAYRYIFELIENKLLLFSLDGNGYVYNRFNPEEAISDIRHASVGDIVLLGTYEQDNDRADGKEPIEWLVLEKEESKVLLVSKYALDSASYHSTSGSVTWEESAIRSWLNQKFYFEAFSAEDQKMILSSDVPADQNDEYGSNSGNATVDKVFLLSAKEAEQLFASDEERTCKPTELAVSKGTYINRDTGCCWWWLRTSGGSNELAARVYSGGSVDYAGRHVECDKDGIRPAVWIDLAL